MTDRRSWNRGTPVRIRLEDGSEVRGQVWEEAETDGQVWVALEGGLYALVSPATGRAQVVDAHGLPLGAPGKVAA